MRPQVDKNLLFLFRNAGKHTMYIYVDEPKTQINVDSKSSPTGVGYVICMPIVQVLINIGHS